MCFYFKQSKEAVELENRFQATVDNKISGLVSALIFNGFEFPKTPVISNQDTSRINLFQWGLIPSFAQNDSIKRYTLNARIETLTEKPSFKNYIENRCLIIADGFYEWKWLDPKGKMKQKYLVTAPVCELFTFAGLWSEWVDRQTGDIIKTYTIVTTEAQGLMRDIHNSKMRMPVILAYELEKDWLSGEALDTFIKNPIEVKATQIISGTAERLESR